MSNSAVPWTIACQTPLSMEILQARILEWVAMNPLQGVFPTQGSKSGLPHCRLILHHLSHRGSLRILKWVAYPFSRGPSQPRNQTRVSCIAGRFFTTWTARDNHKDIYWLSTTKFSFIYSFIQSINIIFIDHPFCTPKHLESPRMQQWTRQAASLPSGDYYILLYYLINARFSSYWINSIFVTEWISVRWAETWNVPEED